MERRGEKSVRCVGEKRGGGEEAQAQNAFKRDTEFKCGNKMKTHRFDS